MSSSLTSSVFGLLRLGLGEQQQNQQFLHPGAADLPVDVLNHIQSLLPIEDYVRFPAVCASWRSAARRNPNSHSDTVPWLFIKNFTGSYFSAFRPSPANDRPFTGYKIPIPCPESLHGDIISSLGPRLAIADGETKKLLLVNPLSPSSTHYLPHHVISDRPISFDSFWKLLAPTDYDGHHGVALALLMPKGASTMAYSASGGPWIDLNGDDDDDDSDEDDGHLLPPLHGQRFTDAVHYKGALFFAVRTHDEAVIALDFSGLRPAVIDMTLNLVHDYLSATKPYPGSYRDARLVISPPYLYLVRWRLINVAGCHPTAKVYVYRLPLPQEEEDDDNRRRRCWVQVNDLDGCSFFLGRAESVSVSARDCPGLRPDRICFPFQNEQFDRCEVSISDYGSDEEDIEGFANDFEHRLIYNLADGSWEKYCRFSWAGKDSPALALRLWTSRWMMPRLAPRSASSSKLLQ